MDIALVSLEKVVQSIPYFAAMAVLLFVGKAVFGLTTKYNVNDEVTEKDNPAFGTFLCLYLLGIAIAVSGLMFGVGVEDPVADFVNIGVFGIAAIILIRLSIVINDKLILSKFSVYKEITEDQNVGTAFVVGGGCVATGFMMYGALSGESASLLTGLRDLVIYWAVGQAILIVGGMIFQAITSYDVHKSIGDDDNLAAGLSFGGFLVAIGIILRSALQGASSDLAAEITATIVLAIGGITLLVLMRVIADKVLLPKSQLSKEIAVDKNPAAGAIVASAFISIGWVYSAAVAL